MRVPIHRRPQAIPGLNTPNVALRLVGRQHKRRVLGLTGNPPCMYNMWRGTRASPLDKATRMVENRALTNLSQQGHFAAVLQSHTVPAYHCPTDSRILSQNPPLDVPFPKRLSVYPAGQWCTVICHLVPLIVHPKILSMFLWRDKKDTKLSDYHAKSDRDQINHSLNIFNYTKSWLKNISLVTKLIDC